MSEATRQEPRDENQKQSQKAKASERASGAGPPVERAFRSRGRASLRPPSVRSGLMSGADVRGYETRTTGREPEAEPEGKSVGAGERSRVAPLSGHPPREPASRHPLQRTER